MYYSAELALFQGLLLTCMSFFYVYHSWKYDQFKPMREALRSMIGLSSRNVTAADKMSNSFHVVMRMTYLFGLPLYAVQGLLTAAVKYAVGFAPVSEGGLPIPCTVWPPRYAKLVLPLRLIMAVCWAGEILVHLEEVMFWMFLLSLTPKSTSWFKSYYFKVWCSSLIPILLSLILPVLRTGKDTLHADSAFRSAAASCDFVITLPFMWVVYHFDGWLEKLKKSGAAQSLVIRLYGFGELNKLRMAFRFLFIISNWMTSADGLTEAAPFNHTLWVVDTLSFFALIGYSVQCMLTMMIFFPRNHAKECGYESGKISEDRKSSHIIPSEKIRLREREQRKDPEVGTKSPLVQYRKKRPSAVVTDSSSSDKTLVYNSQSQSASLHGKMEGSAVDVSKVSLGNPEKSPPNAHSEGKERVDLKTTLPNKYAVIEVTQSTSSDVYGSEDFHSRRPSNIKHAHSGQGPLRARSSSESMKGSSEVNSLSVSAGAPGRQSSLKPFQGMLNRSLSSENQVPDATRLIHPAIRNYRSPIDVVGYSAEDQPEEAAFYADYDD